VGEVAALKHEAFDLGCVSRERVLGGVRLDVVC